jgi:hypothetical protein
LSVSANGTGLSYQWFKDGVAINGATATSLSVASVGTADAGTYTVVLSNPCGSDTSDAAVVSINGSVGIAAQFNDRTACKGEAILFALTPSGDLNTITTYSWYLNGNMLPLETGPSINFIADVSTAGTYTASINTLCGVVNAAPAVLTVNPTYNIDLPEVFACGSYTLPWGQTANNSGSFSQTFTSASGCDSTINVAVNITLPVQTILYETACDSFLFNGNVYTISQQVIEDFNTANGCDSIVTLNLTINYSENNTSDVTACQSYNWIDGNTYTQSGIYTYATTTAAGCVRNETLNLTILTPTVQVDTVYTCQPYYWAVIDAFIEAPGGTFVNFDDQNCTIDSLTVIFKDPYVISFDSIPTVTACGSYVWNDGTQEITYSTPVANELLIAIFPDPSGQGCDSTTAVNLTLLPANTTTTTIADCGSYTWSLSGETYTQSGTYTYVADSVNAPCDIAVLDLTINTPSVTTSTVDTCNSYTWAADGITYTQSGTYTYVADPVNAPCNVEVLDLTIGTGGTNTTQVNTCGSYTWTLDGNTYTQSGTYTFIGSCTTELLELTLDYTLGVTDIISICDSIYTWAVNGQTYTADGFYTDTTGCFINTLELTLFPAGTTTIVAESACGSYTWIENGVTYTQSGQYTAPGQNTCDVIVLNLTITPSSTTTVTDTSCDTYTWVLNGITYTQSGSYTFNVGCDTTVLDLTILPSSTTTTAASACDAYTWSINNTTYTQSGSYTVVSGCNTELLNLTITPTTTDTTFASACDSYTWSVDSATYTQSGNYSIVNGCNTALLVLSITTSTIDTTTETACDSYTWAVDGITYTQSGIYSVSGLCKTDILNLTIIPSNSVTTSESACGSYTWSVNGTTYTQSGIYTAVNGCSTDILNLNITTGITNTTNASACDSYTWSVDGTTYTQSGNYTFVSGCDTEVLNLSITPSVTNTATVSACGSYTWSVDGVTYTQSGTYSFSSNCTNDVLVLTLSPLSVVANTVSACDFYVWPVTGDTLVNSGVYTDTSACTVNELVLTLSPTTLNSTVLTVCDNYEWPVNNQIYTTTGFDTVVVGCDVYTLEVTVNESIVDTQTVVSCGPYFWSLDSTTYTQSGFYTTSISDSCRIFVLDLTVQPQVYDSTFKEECTFYTWPVTNQTYYVSGVYAFTPSGTCTTYVLTLNLTTTKPRIPGPISGQTTGLCTDTVTYSVTPVLGASSYSWSVPNPNQVSIISGQGTNSITVVFNNFTGTGSIAVLASNRCGSSSVRRLTITSTPARPGTIITGGPVCQGVPVTYSVSPVAGADGYQWSTSIASALISGQGSNTILVVWPTGIISNQNVSVFAYNACSNSGIRSQNTSVSVCTNRNSNSGAGTAVVFPNPARDRATLQFESTAAGRAFVRLFDLSGRCIWSSMESVVAGLNRSELDFGSVPATGVYMVELRLNETVERIRVIIE